MFIYIMDNFMLQGKDIKDINYNPMCYREVCICHTIHTRWAGTWWDTWTTQEEDHSYNQPHVSLHKDSATGHQSWSGKLALILSNYEPDIHAVSLLLWPLTLGTVNPYRGCYRGHSEEDKRAGCGPLPGTTRHQNSPDGATRLYRDHRKPGQWL